MDATHPNEHETWLTKIERAVHSLRAEAEGAIQRSANAERTRDGVPSRRGRPLETER
jgi:hypothetical protein